jgi:uroporphyrinogen-III synthase
MALESSISLLHRVSSIVSSDRSLDEMLGEIIGMTVQATECDACLVYLIDHEANEMVLRASQVPHAKDLGELRIKIGEGVTGWVAEHRSVVALPSNASADPRFKRFQALVEDTYEAYLSVPIVSGGEAIGVINVHHRDAHAHSQEEIATLIFIGEQMGAMVAKARLIEEAATVRQQLEDRKVVERAKGIIQQKYNTTEEDAYFRLRNQSRRLRRPMRELAEAIILAEEVEQP